jgi:tetratricopeptide (TPR) repeat protein
MQLLTIASDTDAKALIEELDGLPLALATAGAYLKRVSSVSLGRYLCLYKQSWERLHENTPRLGSYADRTLSSTWQLSYDQIQEQNPLAGHLLRWWAYFNNDDLWLELLQREHDDEDAANGLPWFKELYDELNFNNAIGTLQDYGFVEPHMSETSQIESRGYSIHSCLHSWSLYMLNRDIDNRLSTFAIKCIASRVPSENDSEFWLLLRRLLPHAIKSCEAYQGNNRDLSWEFSNLASLYEAQGKLVEAEEMGQLALQEFERAWGSDHMSTLDMINNLGKVYEAQGRLKKAEAMYKRALEGYEKAWGLGHESILTTINNLGNVYNAQGRLKEAEAMYKRALEGKKKAYGSHHMSTLKTINNLGIVYEAQGRLKEAEAMYKRALEGYEKAWGSHHTSTLSTINNLGGLCETQGRLKEAEAMYKRALDGYEKACGSDHMSTLNMINNIGIVYTAQGRLNEAEAIYKRALEGKEKACGSHNPSTLDTINNLGILYEAQGRLKEAEAMHQRALEGKEKTWGSHHTSTLDTINNLGVVYTAQGRLKEAEAMYKRALQGYENAHGSDSMDTVPSVLNVLLNLGAFYNNLQNKREARLYYDRAQCGLLEVYGPVDERYLEVSAIIESLSAYEWPLQSMNWKHTLSGAGKLWLYTMGAFQARRE